MKKFLAIISALALVIGCLSVMAAAAELPAPLTGEYELIKKVSNVMAWEGGPLTDMEKFVQGSDLKPADGNQYLEFVVEAREGDPSKGLFKCSPNDWSWNPEIEVVKGDATKTGIYTIMVPVAEFTKALTDAGLTLSSTMVHHGGGIATFLEARLYTYTPAETDDTEEPENLVSLDGKKYTEAVELTFTTDGDKNELVYPYTVNSWSWNSFCSYQTTPNIGTLAKLLAEDGVYVKVTMESGSLGSVMIQGEKGNGSVNAETAIGKAYYYNGKALTDAYLTEVNKNIDKANAELAEGADPTPNTTDPGAYTWNLQLCGGGEASSIANVQVVRLTEYVPADDGEETVGKYTGWFVTGPETHAMRIGRAIITMPHEYDEDGDCIFCRHHVETEAEEVEITE